MIPAAAPLPVDRLAHKLRNPLGCVRLLADELSTHLMEPQRALARDLAREVERTCRILNAAVLASGARLQRRHAVDLVRVLREAAGAAGATWEDPPSWRFDTESLAQEQIWGDEALLTALFVELLTNAALSGSGVVEVVAQSVAGGVFVRILDRGTGLPKDLEDPFAPFVSGWPGRAGLGLTVAARIAALHGGRIDLSERAGGGTQAEVWLPAVDEAPPGGES
ncbi:MAG: HAMP domain-containing histidine kinase [Myxococcales bacterium]|nr:HAMP domain-containing histidine kinase [Myxococcales bacterium]